MRKIDRLRKEALQSCNFRGHTMGRFIRIGDGGMIWCKKCEAWVQILTHPQPNQIDIGGPAVALNCPAGKEWL